MCGIILCVLRKNIVHTLVIVHGFGPLAWCGLYIEHVELCLSPNKGLILINLIKSFINTVPNNTLKKIIDTNPKDFPAWSLIANL